ncbi:MAG: nuclear transport factor 2 family protein [Myxococcota bacterium]|nr:nuclear transport factor 2 family protein [Myxococcota bacterium]MDW8361625.1 nuclear transport factor 2 family protein [Myxococcales bacterium]
MAPLVALLAVACAGPRPSSSTPDESRDLDLERETRRGRSVFSAEGTVPAGPDVGGSRWRFVEAHCTEGPLDLSRRGFSQELRVHADAEGLLLVYDHAFAAEGCTQTIVQRARPTRDPRQWVMIEEARVAQPATEACEGRMEDERPGEVRRAGQFLEVLVQRSFVWCNGFEVKMVYAPLPPAAPTNDQLARHWAAHFNRRDPDAIAALFSDAASLLDPFVLNATGGPTRHEGRRAIRDWYAQVLSGVEWLALRLESTAPGPQPNQIALLWSYMDPRLAEPLRGRALFTVAAGEVYENRFELLSPPSAPSGT